MLSNFPSIVKYLLSILPQNDYPKLDTFSFVSCWLSFVLDQSQTGMRCLFQRLNIRGIDISVALVPGETLQSSIGWHSLVEYHQ